MSSKKKAPVMARRLGLAILVAVALASPPEIHAAGVAHAPFLQRVYGVGHETTGIAAGDFDNDGRLDLVTASYVAPYLSMLFGNDSGTFDPEVRVPGSTSDTTWDVLVADFDGDGNDDIATRSFYSVNVWLGNGDGTFAPPTSYPCYSNPPIANSLAVADFNSDGKPDIVAAGVGHTVLLSTGDGAFDVMFLSNGGSNYVLTGDFNGDGFADFADGIRVWLREGGPFSPVFAPVASGVGGSDGVAFDFDNDGHLDIAIGGGYNVIVHLGRGNGFFDPAVSYPVPITARELVLADLNGDNAPDLVASSTRYPGSLDQPVVLLSNGDGTFGDATSYFAPLHAARMVSGDFSGDGRVDVAFAPFYGQAVMPPDKAGNETLSLVYVMEGDGQGGLVTEIVERYDVGDGPATRAPGSIVAADFNGDGHLDLATANSESDDVSLLLGNPDGSSTELGSLPIGGVPISLALGFFDPGVIPDLAVARQGAQDVLILLGNGDGTFTSASVAAVGSAPAAVVQADFNGDGLQDLATANTASNDISVFLGAGDGTFSTPATFPVGTGPTALAVVHLSASGGPDLAVVNAGSSDLSILPGNGDGTFGTAVLYPSSSVLQPAIKVADVNGDGRQDVVVVAFNEPHIQIFPGDGAGGLSTPLEVNFGTGVVDVAIVDLDGDGRLDLATTHRAVSLMGVSFGTESGFATRVEFATEARGRFAMGDFDGNGLPDLAVVGSYNQAVAVHLNQLPVFLEFASNSSTLTWPRLLGTDSYNIYRGDLADLYDQDADGLPDAGYGSCRNDLDPDTTDTVFVDDEIPFPGEGYFYLMARVAPQGETDLGSTSSGQPRVPSVACP